MDWVIDRVICVKLLQLIPPKNVSAIDANTAIAGDAAITKDAVTGDVKLLSLCSLEIHPDGGEIREQNFDDEEASQYLMMLCYI